MDASHSHLLPLSPSCQSFRVVSLRSFLFTPPPFPFTAVKASESLLLCASHLCCSCRVVCCVVLVVCLCVTYFSLHLPPSHSQLSEPLLSGLFHAHLFPFHSQLPEPPSCYSQILPIHTASLFIHSCRRLRAVTLRPDGGPDERGWRLQPRGKKIPHRILQVEYAERRIKYGNLFIFSPFYEYSNLEYVRVPV